jgi:hypothetical protein
MVIGDLTLRRSGASFGSFHLIRLLYDSEYIFYLVEHRVAMVTGEFVNMTLRPKDEAGSTSVPPFPVADHRHHYTPLSAQSKSSSGNNNSSQQHLQHSMADVSLSNNVERPKLS